MQASIAFFSRMFFTFLVRTAPLSSSAKPHCMKKTKKAQMRTHRMVSSVYSWTTICSAAVVSAAVCNSRRWPAAAMSSASHWSVFHLDTNRACDSERGTARDTLMTEAWLLIAGRGVAPWPGEKTRCMEEFSPALEAYATNLASL